MEQIGAGCGVHRSQADEAVGQAVVGHCPRQGRLAAADRPGHGELHAVVECGHRRRQSGQAFAGLGGAEGQHVALGAHEPAARGGVAGADGCHSRRRQMHPGRVGP